MRKLRCIAQLCYKRKKKMCLLCLSAKMPVRHIEGTEHGQTDWDYTS